MDNLNCCGVYKITNSINGKYYIGSSNNIKNRIRKHFELLNRNKHHSIHFQNAYNLYGKSVFNVELLEISDKNNILCLEQKYLDSIINWEDTYNISKFALSNANNYILLNHSNELEIRNKLSKSSKGRNIKPFYINNIKYETLNEAANIYSVTISTISNRLKNWKLKEYYYENIPKDGEYNTVVHSIYKNYIKIIKDRRIFKCKCGIEISKDAEFCYTCRKIRKEERLYINLVTINNIEYNSAKDASNILGIEYATLIYRINSNSITFKDYYYTDKPKNISILITKEETNKKISEKLKGKNNFIKKPFIINNKRFDTISEASLYYNVSRTKIHKRLNNIKFDNYKYIV